MQVGFVGIGVMGRAMVRNVLRGGHRVTIFDRVPEAMQPLVEAGATAAASLGSVAAGSEIMITMLPRPTDVEEVVLGEGGLAGSAAPGSILIDMSTGSPLVARRLAERLARRSIRAIDCPVGRTEPHAIAGTLLLMAGGDANDVEQARPVLMCMGNELIHCGGPGAGQAMKLVNNLLTTVITQADTEALLLGTKAGLSLDTMRTVLSKTMANNTELAVAMPEKVFKGDFVPGFSLELARKDLGLATELARELDVPVPLVAATVQTCALLIAQGWGKKDVGAILAGQAELLGLAIRDGRLAPGDVSAMG